MVLRSFLRGITVKCIVLSIALVFSGPLVASAMGTNKIHERLAMLYGLPLETAVSLWGEPGSREEVAGKPVVVWDTRYKQGKGATPYCRVSLTLDKNRVIMNSSVEGSDLTAHSGESCDGYFKKPWFKQQKKKE